MFKHVFAEMNDMLDEIMKYYPSAQGPRKEELMYKWGLLRRMSDSMIDQWLAFEEKMSDMRAVQQQHNAGPVHSDVDAYPELTLDACTRGIGYFRLTMYREAAEQFGQVLAVYPQSLMAHMYRAISNLYNDYFQEAASGLRQALELTSDAKTKAVLYNALGCAETKSSNVEAALQYFKLALNYDPSLQEALQNMEACRTNSDLLRFGEPFHA
ncbi:hypothetical protein [Paenibacillus sp. FSL K6-1230]|uniref:hypothetical protein n=1 Tax=Paenibacillus sp. FSL K6-1230 TaxID=2921603 RepID=UPI0030F93AD7